jgi:simple sugar transport system ATP-binding protein
VALRALILDEPTAALAPAEADDLFQWVRAFASAAGVVLITHKLREAMNITDYRARRGTFTWDGARRSVDKATLPRCSARNRLSTAGSEARPQRTGGGLA